MIISLRQVNNETFFSWVDEDSLVLSYQKVKTTYCQKLPLFRRLLPQTIDFYFKNLMEPSHPKNIQNYITLIQSRQPLNISFGLLHLKNLYINFPQTILNETIINTLLSVLLTDDFGYHDFKIKLLKIIYFLTSFSQNKNYFISNQKNILVLLDEEQQFYNSYIKKILFCQKHQQDSQEIRLNFNQTKKIQEQKICEILPIMISLDIQKDIFYLVQRQFPSDDYKFRVLEYLTFFSGTQQIIREQFEFLIEIFVSSNVRNQCVIVKIFVNQLEFYYDEIMEQIDIIQQLFVEIANQIFDILGVKDILEQDYWYQLDSSKKQEVLLIFEQIDPFLILFYQVQADFDVESLMNIIVCTQQIRPQFCLVLLQNISLVLRYQHVERLLQITRRAWGKQKIQEYELLYYSLQGMGVQSNVYTGFKLLQDLKDLDQIENYILSNYQDITDIGTLSCIMAKETNIQIDLVESYWQNQAGTLAEFNKNILQKDKK